MVRLPNPFLQSPEKKNQLVTKKKKRKKNKKQQTTKREFRNTSYSLTKLLEPNLAFSEQAMLSKTSKCSHFTLGFGAKRKQKGNFKTIQIGENLDSLLGLKQIHLFIFIKKKSLPVKGGPMIDLLNPKRTRD